MKIEKINPCSSTAFYNKNKDKNYFYYKPVKKYADGHVGKTNVSFAEALSRAKRLGEVIKGFDKDR